VKGRVGITVLYSFQFYVLYEKNSKEGYTAIVSIVYYIVNFQFVSINSARSRNFLSNECNILCNWK